MKQNCPSYIIRRDAKWKKTKPKIIEKMLLKRDSLLP